jgi:hypothetical protein
MTRITQRSQDDGGADGETYRARLRQYERRERSLVWIGAGLLGLIALAAGDLGAMLLRGDPLFIRASVVTLVLVGGAALGASRMGFEWANTTIRREIDDGTAKEVDPLPKCLQNWPRPAELFRDESLACFMLSGLAFLVGSWWS